MHRTDVVLDEGPLPIVDAVIDVIDAVDKDSIACHRPHVGIVLWLEL